MAWKTHHHHISYFFPLCSLLSYSENKREKIAGKNMFREVLTEHNTPLSPDSLTCTAIYTSSYLSDKQGFPYELKPEEISWKCLGEISESLKPLFSCVKMLTLVVFSLLSLLEIPCCIEKIWMSLYSDRLKNGTALFHKFPKKNAMQKLSLVLGHYQLR